jgi:predicted deacetylase
MKRQQEAIMKKMAFRIDDVCPQMHQERFDATLDLLRKYGIKPLLGVIPDNQDPYLMQNGDAEGFWQKMKQLRHEGCAIAMHGYRHVYDTKAKSMFTGGSRSEFAGHALEVQYDRLIKGMEIMRRNSLDTDIFFAPAHSYDKNTLRALNRSGFRIVSDGRSHYSYERLGLKFIPCRSYRVAVKCRGITTVALHPCTNGEREYATLQKTLHQNKKYLASYSELLDSRNYRLFWQLADEKTYVLYSRFVSPVILSIKKTLRPLRKKKKGT